jgi:hypothetical protein
VKTRFDGYVYSHSVKDELRKLRAQLAEARRLGDALDAMVCEWAATSGESEGSDAVADWRAFTAKLKRGGK